MRSMHDGSVVTNLESLLKFDSDWDQFENWHYINIYKYRKKLVSTTVNIFV